MKVVLQRVKNAKVKVNDKEISKIEKGFLIFLSIANDDSEKQVNSLVDKIFNLRVFSDENGKMNLSLKQVKGEVLVVSQFTLYANCRKGNRPSFKKAAEPKKAEILYNLFFEKISKLIPAKKGIFGAKMEISLVNDGPVTLILES